MRRTLRRLALAVVAGLAGLAAVEIGWRVFRTGGFGPTTNPRYVVRDDELGWRYRAGAKVRHATEDFDVEVEINAQGFRDSTPAPPGSRPIVVLGDSIAFGWGVEERQAFPARLEEATALPVENLAVSGYGTDQEALLFEREGARREPRAVVLVVSGNDVEEAARPRIYGRAKPFLAELPPAPPRSWPALRDAIVPPAHEGFLRRHSQLWASLAKAREAAREAPLSSAELELGRERVMALLTALAERARMAGAGAGGLVVCSFEDPWLGERLTGVAGLRHLDLAPALAQAAGVRPVRFEHDNHWTVHGHAAVAEVLARELDEAELLR